MRKVNRLIATIILFAYPIYLGKIYAQENSTENKSEITITYPTTSTVWETAQLAELYWNTKNMDTTRFIRFYLTRDKMMVQELGRFKNTGYAKGIQLAKNISSGNRYQVMGIELFPNNKQQVAKYATPFFSIKNVESDLRKKQFELAQQQSGLSNKERNISKKNHPIRQQLEGRKISYVKNLMFDSKHLTVKIWDHEKEDGDIVSIYLNGEIVLSEHLLTNTLREFDIDLDPEKPNDFILYAHNLGEVSPNTVSVEITSTNKSEKLTLNSYLRRCEAVLINVEK